MDKVFNLFYRVLAYKPNLSIGDCILLSSGFVALGVVAGYWIGIDRGLEACVDQLKTAGNVVEVMTTLMKAMMKKLYAYSI